MLSSFVFFALSAFSAVHSFVCVFASSPQFIHRFQNAFANLEQFPARLHNHRFGKQLFRRDRFQSGLGFVQMIGASFETGHRECAISKITTFCDSVQCAREFCAGGLEFKNELLQIFIVVMSNPNSSVSCQSFMALSKHRCWSG